MSEVQNASIDSSPGCVDLMVDRHVRAGAAIASP